MSDGLSIEYFRNILTREAKSLTQLCEKWARILEQRNCQEEIEQQDNEVVAHRLGIEEDEEQKALEEFFGAIRSTIGQAKLLMSQRFKQFSDLIDNCESNTGQMPTRLDDLLGFWEMISFQVDDVMQKFKSLDDKHHKQVIQ